MAKFLPKIKVLINEKIPEKCSTVNNNIWRSNGWIRANGRGFCTKGFFIFSDFLLERKINKCNNETGDWIVKYGGVDNKAKCRWVGVIRGI